MNLLLITEQFPYGKGEQFMTAEIEVLADYFERITIVPLVLPHTFFVQYPLPDNVLIRTDITHALHGRRTARKSRSMLSLFAELPASIRVDTMYDAVLCAPLTARSVVADFAAESVDLAQCIQDMVEPADRAIVYSYWLMQGAAAASLLRTAGDCRYAVARAHRYDVFPHASGARRLPLRKSILEGLDVLYPCCHAAEKELMNTGSALQKAIIKRYLGTPSQKILSQPSTDGILRIVSCSTLKEHKRVPFIADALASVKRSVEWVHIGGEGEALLALQADMKTLPASVRASAPGEMPHRKVYEYYRTHPVDVFVNVSTSEGLPVSIMEAMSFSIPCIATDVGGSSELVSSSNGVLLQSHSTPSDVAAILEAWDCADSARRAAALHTQQTFFDASTNYTAFAEEIIAAAAHHS